MQYRNFTPPLVWLPERVSQEQLDAAAVLMDDEIREAMTSTYAPGFDNPSAFLVEYRRRHMAKHGEVFRY